MVRKAASKKSASRPAPRGTSHRPWAILGYFVADTTDRTTFDQRARTEVFSLCKSADLKSIGVSIHLDLKKEPGVFEATMTPSPDGRPRHEDLWATASTQPSLVSDVRYHSTDLNSAEAATLRRFLVRARRNHPHKRYLTYFYGHTQGPLGLFDDRSPDGQVQVMPVPEFAEAIDTATVVLCRNCFMNTVETAVELHGVAEFLVGTQSKVPIDGTWPWVSLVANLMTTADSAEVADSIALELGGYYAVEENREGFGDVPYSLVSIGEVPRLRGPLTALTAILEQSRGTPVEHAYAGALESARFGNVNNPERPGDPALLDVGALCRALLELPGDSAAGPAGALLDALDEKLIPRHFSRKDVFSGVSVFYLPTLRSQLAVSLYTPSNRLPQVWRDRYPQLKFCDWTNWHTIALNPLKPGPVS